MTQDITKPNSHIFWIWTVIFSTVIIGATAYNTLVDRTNKSDLAIKVQLADISARLKGIELAILEIKSDVRRQERAAQAYHQTTPSRETAP